MDWINWKTISTSIALAIILATGGWFHTIYAEHKTLCATVTAHISEYSSQQQQQQVNAAVLKQIARDIGDIKLMTLTVMGLAKVQNDGGDEASALINNNGRAMMYRESQRVRVTNMASAEQESVTVKINGTFSMPDENKIIMLSKKAGAMLSLQPNQVVRVKLEPVVEQGNDR
jgi:hypothetical protein